MIGRIRPSPAPSEVAPERAAPRSALTLGFALATLLSGSCSIVLDSTQPQCSTDADCLGRGLNGTCSNNVCQPANAPSTTNGIEATSGTMATPPTPTAGTDAAGSSMAPATAGAPPVATGMTSGAGGMSPRADNTAGISAAGAAGSAMCSGAGCPECSVNQDCYLKGMPGAMCVDSMCWAPPPQCSADADCLKLGPEFMGGRCLATQCRPNPKWRCEPAAPVAMTGTIELRVPVIDALNLKPIANVRVVACNKLDPMCDKPVTNATSSTDGSVKLTVPANFAGYLQQTDRTDYSPAMYFLPPVLPPDGQLENFPLLSSGAILNALALTLGTGLDPKRGHMMLIANDCSGKTTVAGVTFSSPQADKSTVQFYVRDQLPSTMAKDTPDAGDGGYLNFPAGTALITAREVKSGIDLATVSLLVRPGFISVSYIRPMTRVTTQN